MDFKYVPESPGYDDPVKPKRKKSFCYMYITLSELRSQPNAKNDVIYSLFISNTVSI